MGTRQPYEPTTECFLATVLCPIETSINVHGNPMPSFKTFLVTGTLSGENL
jgi:hypothetical protein